jgi:hypothetical protein
MFPLSNQDDDPEVENAVTIRQALRLGGKGDDGEQLLVVDADASARMPPTQRRGNVRPH